MENHFQFEYPPDLDTLKEINSGQICPVARYVFDREIIVKPDDFFALIDGQIFRIRNGVGTLVEGKWDRL